MRDVFIGTSGWTYGGWRGPFYPLEVPKKDWLRYYSGQFPTTEINGSFYRTPSLDAVRAWRDQAPKEFLFAWKASKFITHWKRLSEKCDNSIALMETRLKVLGPKTGPVLFQLPPRFTADRERLAAFLKMLPRRHRYAFEFRRRRRRAMSMCAAMVRAEPTRTIIPMPSSADTHLRSENGGGRGARSMSISTTIRRARRRRMRGG